MRAITRGAVAVTVAVGLACGGMMPGNTIVTQPVTPTQPFSTSWTDAGTSKALWLAYDLDYTQPYQVKGTVELQADGAVVHTWELDFTKDGSPVVGSSSRITWGNVKTEVNGTGSESGQVKLGLLPEGAVGRELSLAGTLDVASGTTVNRLELLVTE
jgi:hypothetical protein